VQLPFASADPCTLEFIGTERVWIKQPGSGLDQRQATLQLCIRALGVQPRPCLIFRGNPKPILWRKKKREKEEAEYDKDVDVMWQHKAWVDQQSQISDIFT
jgi:hypothetical protein